MKLEVQEIEMFRESVEFLDHSSQAIFDCFDDPDFRKGFYTALERIKDLSAKLGTITITIRA